MAKFYPVLHAMDNVELNKSNLQIVFDSGADGVFLINHGQAKEMAIDFLFENAYKLQSNKFDIGVNCLDMTNIEALNVCRLNDFKMLWSDNAGFDFRWFGIKEIFDQKEFYTNIWCGSVLANSRVPKFFGGVHFKYQTGTTFPIETSVDNAYSFVDVITLSGERTGSPPTLDFIKSAIRDHNPAKFAIASGINEENVKQFLPYVHNYLVASSLLKDNSDQFDPKKVNNMCKIIKEC